MRKGKIIVIMGLPASGKSTVANIVSKSIKAKILNSDVIRKRLAGIDPYSRGEYKYEKGIYSPQFTKKVYNTMIEEAIKEAKKTDVILDATFSQRRFRDKLRKRCKENNIKCYFFFLNAEEREILKRLKKREFERTVSDANIDIYKKVKEKFEFPQDNEAIIIDANRKPEAISEEIIKILNKEEEDGF